MKGVPHFRAMLRINVMLLYACVLAGVAWLCWPETAEGWRSGILSIFCGLSAFGLAWQGFGETVRHIRTLRQFDESVARKRKPHSDRTIETDALRRGGMVD